MRIYFKLDPKSKRYSINDFHIFEVSHKKFFDELSKKEPDHEKWTTQLYLDHGKDLVQKAGHKDVKSVTVDISYRDIGNYIMAKDQPEPSRCNVI